MLSKEILVRWRRRLNEIIEVATPEDKASRAYDLLNMITIVINLIVSLAYTFDTAREKFGPLLIVLEGATVAFFAVDYLLRLVTAKMRYKQLSEIRAAIKYALSFTGVVDLLSFLPYGLPFFFPSGAIAFRMFRIVRIFRLFRINSYYDSLNVITEVIASKGQQLISSVFIIVVLMLAASLCMYSLEHDAQPHVFTNAFSGIWWAVSTLLTVGYGDIYPITDVGRLFPSSLRFWVWAWLRFLPVLSPQASSISIPASSASANMATRRRSTSSRFTWNRAISGSGIRLRRWASRAA